MKLIIEIDLDGAAFEDRPDDELDHIFNSLASKAFYAYNVNSVTQEFDSHQICDINGNICGSVRVKD